VSFDIPEYTGEVTGLGTVRFSKPSAKRNSSKVLSSVVIGTLWKGH